MYVCARPAIRITPAGGRNAGSPFSSLSLCSRETSIAWSVDRFSVFLEAMRRWKGTRMTAPSSNH